MNDIAWALEGFLPADVETRFTNQGQQLCTFSVAVWDAKRKEGDETEWVKCTVWGGEAERLAPALKKGAEVYVSGWLKLNVWTAADGTQKSALNCSAWECVIKAAIGRKALPKRPERELAA